MSDSSFVEADKKLRLDRKRDCHTDKISQKLVAGGAWDRQDAWSYNTHSPGYGRLTRQLRLIKEPSLSYYACHISYHVVSAANIMSVLVYSLLSLGVAYLDSARSHNRKLSGREGVSNSGITHGRRVLSPKTSLLARK